MLDVNRGLIVRAIGERPLCVALRYAEQQHRRVRDPGQMVRPQKQRYWVHPMTSTSWSRTELICAVAQPFLIEVVERFWETNSWSFLLRR